MTARHTLAAARRRARRRPPFARWLGILGAAHHAQIFAATGEPLRSDIPLDTRRDFWSRARE